MNSQKDTHKRMSEKHTCILCVFWKFKGTRKNMCFNQLISRCLAHQKSETSVYFFYITIFKVHTWLFLLVNIFPSHFVILKTNKFHLSLINIFPTWQNNYKNSYQSQLVHGIWNYGSEFNTRTNMILFPSW